MEPKICPSCKEQNNPTFAYCWKCGYDYATGKVPPKLTGITEGIVDRNITREYYKSGQLKLEGVFKDGKPEGLFKTYHALGQLSSEGVYKKGKLEGTGKTYFENYYKQH